MNRPRLPRLGLFAALLALAVQLAFGAAVPQSGLGKAGFGIICHSSAANGKAPDQPLHQPPDCALCPLCAAIAMPALMPGVPPPLPRPRVEIAHAPGKPPPQTGPFFRPIRFAQPRGPPPLA
jgi:hypothetical protein